ncbi:MAG: outer membrane beta-barrel protein [Planctomycetota bacterium]
MRSLALLLLVVGLVACASPPTSLQFPRYGWYARLGPELMIADFEAEDGNQTPAVSPGLGLTVGAINTQGYDEGWGLEATLEYTEHKLDNNVTANYKRYLVGGRYVFNMDHKIRPSVTFGAAYHVIQMQDADNEFRIDGPGVYGGIGADWQLTESWAVGVDWKLHLGYLQNSFDKNFVLWSVAGLWLTYYF